MRKKDLKAVKIFMELNVKKIRRRGRSKKKWLNAIECDINTVGVCMNNVRD